MSTGGIFRDIILRAEEASIDELHGLITELRTLYTTHHREKMEMREKLMSQRTEVSKDIDRTIAMAIEVDNESGSSDLAFREPLIEDYEEFHIKQHELDNQILRVEHELFKLNTGVQLVHERIMNKIQKMTPHRGGTHKHISYNTIRAKKMRRTRYKKTKCMKNKYSRKRGGIGAMQYGLATNFPPQSHANLPINSNAPLPDQPGLRPRSPSGLQFVTQPPLIPSASAQEIKRPAALRLT